jgi:hypothetical protein
MTREGMIEKGGKQGRQGWSIATLASITCDNKYEEGQVMRLDGDASL